MAEAKTEHAAVKVKINKVSRGTMWYAKMVGQTVEARKSTNAASGNVSYQYMPGDEYGNIAVFNNDDIQEVNE